MLRADVSSMDLYLLIGRFSRRSPGPPAEADNVRDRLLAIAIHGLRPDADPLPGRAPDPSRYHELCKRA